MRARSDPGSGLVSLADGTTWKVAACDEVSRQVVDRLVAAMRLRLRTGPAEREIRVRIVGKIQANGPGRIDGSDAGVRGEALSAGEIDVTLDERAEGDGLVRGLLRLASVIAVEAIRNGGVLIHGGLAEWRGMGVVLAGPSGVGKSTACRRLPATWNVLSDDAALLVRGADGGTWVHPWPTWGAVFSEVEGASWEVGRAVPLGAICFLSKSGHDAAQRIREGEAVCLAVETMEQLLPTLTKGLSEDEKRSVRMQQFQNLCGLLRGVHAYTLGVRRRGRFWEALEAALMSETLQASVGIEG